MATAADQSIDEGRAAPTSLEYGPLRIASYNIHRCKGTDGKRDVERVAQVIQELECDTIGLQEVDSRGGPGTDSQQLEYLAAATGMQAVAGTTIIRHDRDYGNALLTRRKILAVRRHDLSFRRFEPRGALEVDIDVAGAMVRVFVMHLGLLPYERRYQMRKVLALLRAMPLDQPAVVLGDINEWLPIGRPLRWLHGLMGKPPQLRTFPVWAPMFALDRVWVRPVGSLLDFSVHRTALSRRASDHYPVKAVVAPEAVSLRERLRP
ncbi:MAG TPA: endonuclease/exonuclease/phosphatase family protein [Steroidobacteraceae bacterium]|jgi:endonuclease/exonuclease/phosphatase family metal-dependent hydrolase|nr:endonuclease/exonuclease/phosphatase family protein [Steroidobacteraceae bacterium]